ncbi:LETM1-related biofilm-associated protein [Flavobacterium sp. NRK F10]|uniref:Letm1 RBD domain-containing protein n=1 Tax=Flavobacterium sediminis TaxID=2201181 RepID=A0A2U8QRJ1_9FLAO|nr:MULTISPECIES: LETM1-related biofilm-associated protein [Flavobacterium]AWM12464.1 hypothetical protein DI487_00265 [Flavobacterium sediminis]MCO6173494.1 LETM1-related biofilm-associated protein [Flavobacterium sp. NRK F10]
MINPSISGWIDKYFHENENNFIDFKGSFTSFYKTVRESGFIYGYTISFNLKESYPIEKFSQDEITKVGLLTSLYYVYTLVTGDTDSKNFIKTAKNFYKEVQHENYIFLKNILPSANNSSKLEVIINDRIQTNANFISKNFSHIITNALLFIDVLAFFNYLKAKNHFSAKYIKDFELCCIKIVSLALNVKQNKTKYDELIIKLFENSLRYTKSPEFEESSLEKLNFQDYPHILERLYLLDLTEMALWNDEKLESKELQFLNEIIIRLQLEHINLDNSCQNIDQFISKYKEEIPYFNYSNPVKHFYDQTNKTVTKLIIRNKNRLIKEISESKELMILLLQSTSRELDETEKKKVKKQLLDICKTIPSLTIFLLPGGGILLPILIKYIPQLLPSSFNENLED